MRSPGWLTLVLAGAVMSLTGCTADVPDDAWILSPLSYDNRLDGDVLPGEPIDVAYPMSLTSDTVGGFWGESVGSWLHVDASGAATRRFNVPLDGDGPESVGAIAAVSPTEVIVTGGIVSPGDLGSIHLFHTESMTWDLLLPSADAIGDVAVRGDSVYFVSYDLDASTLTVRRFDLGSSAEPQTVSPAFPGTGPAAIDLDSLGRLYLATQTERMVLAPDGTVESRRAVASTRPGVSVSETDRVLWSGHDRPPVVLPTFVDGGSNEARSVIEAHTACDEPGYSVDPERVDLLTLGYGVTAESGPLICEADGFAWLDDERFVLSVGDEGGAPLVVVTPASLEG